MKLRLACYFPAEKPLYFEIKIDYDETVFVDELFEVVYDKLKLWGQDVQLKDLSLYKTDIPTMADEDLCTRALQWLHEQPLQTHLEVTARLTTLFPAAPSLDTIHILVSDPSVMELLDTLDEPDAQYIRKVQKALRKAISDLSSGKSPSEVVENAEGVNSFLDPDKGRVYLDRVPVAMFSVPLARLQQSLGSLDRVEISRVDVERAAGLLGAAISFFDNEEQRQAAISDEIDLLVGQPGDWKWCLNWAGGIKPYASWWHKDFVTVLSELKNTVGIGGDAVLQATAVYSKIISQDKFKKFRGTCNFPVVLIGLTGNRIQISAAVCAGTVYVSNLCTLDLASGFHSSQNAIRLARVFKVISSCRNDLQTYYDRVLNPPAACSHWLSALYPNPTLTSGIKPPSLTYRKFMARTGQLTSEIPKLGNMMTAMYLATLDDTNEEVIVKFTARYNKEAHTLLANAGLAPKLYCCERIVGDLHMVVMERVVGKTIWQLYEGNPGIPTTVVDQVEMAVNLLHSKEIVFGDLRDNNILYTQKDGKVFLIDFDWSNKVGEGRYPGTLNPDSLWAEHVGPYVFMQKADDIWQVNRLRKRCHAQDSPCL